MKTHYFDQDIADADDMALGMAKMQEYVPETCLLGGTIVMSEVNNGKNPCWDCNGPRLKCKGKSEESKQ